MCSPAKGVSDSLPEIQLSFCEIVASARGLSKDVLTSLRRIIDDPDLSVLEMRECLAAVVTDTASLDTKLGGLAERVDRSVLSVLPSSTPIAAAVPVARVIIKTLKVPATEGLPKCDELPTIRPPRDFIYIFVGKMPLGISSKQVAWILKELKNCTRVFDVTIIQQKDPVTGIMKSKGGAYVLIPAAEANNALLLHHTIDVINVEKEGGLQVSQFEGPTGTFVCELARIPVREYNLNAVNARQQGGAAGQFSIFSLSLIFFLRLKDTLLEILEGFGLAIVFFNPVGDLIGIVG